MRSSPFRSNWLGATRNLWIAKKFERLRSQFSATFQLALPSSNKGGGQPERQGSNRFRLAKTTTLHVHYAFTTFLCRGCTTTTRNFVLVSRVLKDVNTWQKFSLSSSRLKYSLLEVKSTKIRQKFTNWVRWSKKGWSVKWPRFTFKWRFRHRRRPLVSWRLY